MLTDKGWASLYEHVRLTRHKSHDMQLIRKIIRAKAHFCHELKQLIIIQQHAVMCIIICQVHLIKCFCNTVLLWFSTEKKHLPLSIIRDYVIMVPFRYHMRK